MIFLDDDGSVIITDKNNYDPGRTINLSSHIVRFIREVSAFKQDFSGWSSTEYYLRYYDAIFGGDNNG